MSCRQKYKKKGKKPGGIKVSDVAGKKMINHRISGERTLFGPIGQGLLYRFISIFLECQIIASNEKYISCIPIAFPT